jgi:CsoR family transcriptional regulator, copper-sensing transcriptional repressor
MAALNEDAARAEILKRLKRAEGQLRGVQRMIVEGAPCLEVAQQFSAVRKALDSTYARMTVCLLEQELRASRPGAKAKGELELLMSDLQKLLTRMT